MTSDVRFAGATWSKSRYSASSGQCVELARSGPVTAVRDSKLGTSSPLLVFDAQAWDTFRTRLQRG